jgi:hypothetical protein
MQAAASAVAQVFTDGEQGLRWIGYGGLRSGSYFGWGWNCYDSFRFGQWLSLFRLDLSLSCFSTVEIVDAEFVVIADAFGKGAFELWVESDSRSFFG